MSKRIRYPFFRELLFFRRPPFFAGTLAPFFLASDRPMAIACSRLFTLPPLPDFPRRSVPRLRRLIALFTLLPAPLLYFLRLDFREERFRVAAIGPPGEGELGAMSQGLFPECLSSQGGPD